MWMTAAYGRYARQTAMGILYRSTLNIKQLDRVCEPSSYECLECCLTSDSALYRTLLVHRSPTALSTLAFLDEFSDCLNESVLRGESDSAREISTFTSMTLLMLMLPSLLTWLNPTILRSTCQYLPTGRVL